MRRHRVRNLGGRMSDPCIKRFWTRLAVLALGAVASRLHTELSKNWRTLGRFADWVAHQTGSFSHRNHKIALAPELGFGSKHNGLVVGEHVRLVRLACQRTSDEQNQQCDRRAPHFILPMFLGHEVDQAASVDLEWT
jgi:hypothetical protein